MCCQRHDRAVKWEGMQNCTSSNKSSEYIYVRGVTLTPTAALGTSTAQRWFNTINSTACCIPLPPRPRTSQQQVGPVCPSFTTEGGILKLSWAPSTSCVPSKAAGGIPILRCTAFPLWLLLVTPQRVVLKAMLVRRAVYKGRAELLFLLAALTLHMTQNLCCCGKISSALLIPRTHHAVIVISETSINEATEQLIAGDTLYSYCKRFKLQSYKELLQ